ncbi:uncharacterized protein CBL_05692 [Carabus blaptoides fortunei]
MKNNDDTILEIEQGHRTARWPTARLVKIFIASTRTDFAEERRQLLEIVGPELQTLYDEQQIEVELVDMHFGSTENDVYDAHLFDNHLYEIQNCHKFSRGCFFLCLIGNKYQPYVLPLQIQEDQFNAVIEKSNDLGLNNELILNWYKLENGLYILQKYRDMDSEQWKNISEEINDFIQNCIQEIEDPIKEKMHYLLESAVEKQFSHALGLAPGTAHRILVHTRDWENLEDGQTSYEDIDIDSACNPNERARQQLKQFRERVTSSISNENRTHYSVPWKSGGIDEDLEEHETYLNKFRKSILDKLKTLINKNLEEEPELKSRKKIVQENFTENITHLTICFEEPEVDFTNSELMDKIKQIIQNSFQTNSRHSPMLIWGNNGSGKTSLVKSIYREIENWFNNTKVLRIVRFISSTPRSSYNLELLRVICQQICIALRLPEGFLPKDASFDPLYINNWFQNLLRLFENLNQVLVIIIDDLHLLNPLDSDIVAALSWLPISLPDNVYLICTTGLGPDQLRLSPVQRERLRNPESYIELPPVDSFKESIEQTFDELETQFGQTAISRLCALITSSEYGLTETELLELLMPTSNIEAVLSLETGNYNFSSMCAVRRNMNKLLKEKLMSGKLLVEWSHDGIREMARKRYLQNQDVLRNTHSEIANLFFSEFTESDNDNSESEAADEPAPLPTDSKDTPFQSTLHSDVTYSQRHVEESWIHLLKAGDTLKLKTLTVCNFDFLLAAVQTISISYLRCILEHVRCYLLDRELELVYHTIRKSTDVLTREPLQLATQIISWLRPVTDHSSGLMSALLTSAMAWCDGFTLPLVVPLNGWLQPPLPAQSRTLNAPNVRMVESTPSGQHVVCVVDCEPQLWHIMSNQLVHTFKGHSGKVICMAITKQSQYLLTGSEDTSIIVWDLKALTLHLRIYEHIAPVLCVTSALSNSVIVSGGDDSSIIIMSLANGKVVMKIDHHRGSVTSVKVTSAGDVLVSGSHDRTVCLWSLETFTLLNTISLVAAITMIDVSADSVFLLAACSDNNLYLRTLATGTELHSLVGHKSKVKAVCMAQDSCRAVVGCTDNRVYIYEMHSGKIMKTLTGQPGEVTAVKVTDKDDFLLTAGGNRVHFYPFRSEDTVKSLLKLNKKCQHHLQAHSAAITCIDIAKDGLLAVTGSFDHLVNIWQLNSHELILTMDGHTGSITCVNFAPNGLFVASGSEDKTVKVWGLTLGLVVSTFTGHQAPVCAVQVMMDSSRIISSDRNGSLNVWLADNGSQIHASSGLSKCLAVTNNMKYTVCTNGDNSMRIWSLIRDDERYTISHSEEITCFVLTMDSLQVITGSRDMSLKVWQLTGGKLSQVLVGHTDAVTCVSVALLDKSIVVSGSCDTNLIVWDINTGSDVHTLSAHLSYVTCVKLSADGTVAVSGSDDKSIIIWDTKRGLQLTSLQLHIPIINLEASSDCSRIVVHLKENQYLPIICLHNTPAKYVKLPTYCAPARDIADPRSLPKRQMRRLLKKEVSLDTYTWQKKYAHLTSNIMIAAMDERLKRRFSVSASMEEISKIPQNKSLGSQTAIAEGASLAQSQHFDQLEALWNKRSPPRRRHNQPLSKQSSLVESRLGSSDEEGMEE